MISRLLVLGVAIMLAVRMQAKVIPIVGAALLMLVVNNPQGRVAALSPPLRLKLCSLPSIAFCGAVATLLMTLVFRLTWLVYFLLPRGEGSVWEQPFKMGVTLVLLALVGGLAGVLRSKVRQRWPHAFGALNNRNEGFYVDEVFLPAVLFPFLWGVLVFADNQWVSALTLMVLAYPVVAILGIPVYALWAWFHSNVMGWLGTLKGKQHMEYEAYEAMVGDQIEWFGVLDLAVDTKQNLYILSGVLPDRITLNGIVRRLKDLGAEVDVTGVTIDRSAQIDYRRLTAVMRRGTPRQRFQLATILSPWRSDQNGRNTK